MPEERWNPISVKFTLGCSLGIISMFVANLVVWCITVKTNVIPLWVYPLIFIGSMVLCFMIPSPIAQAIGDAEDEWEDDPRHGGVIGWAEKKFKK